MPIRDWRDLQEAIGASATNVLAADGAGGAAYTAVSSLAVSSLAGTSNQILVNGGVGPAAGAVTLTIPQLAAAYGGTGRTTYTGGAIPFAPVGPWNGLQLSQLAPNTSSTVRKYLMTIHSAAPVYNQVAVGDLDGTGLNSQGLLVYDGSSVQNTAGPGAGQIMIGNATPAPSFQSVTGDVTINSSAVTAIGAGKVTNTMLTGPVSLAKGGTNANLIASNGGIFYSTGSAAAILAGTATPRKALLSQSNAAPIWSTETYAAPGTSGNAMVSDGVNWTSALVTKLGAATGTSLAVAGVLTSSGATSGVGYAAGAGGMQTQLTSKSTGVTLNACCGTIVMHGAALNAATTVTFTLTNSAVAATDLVVVQHDSVGTLGAYNFACAPAAGSVAISVRNVHTASLSEAIKLRFVVLKAVTA